MVANLLPSIPLSLTVNIPIFHRQLRWTMVKLTFLTFPCVDDYITWLYIIWLYITWLYTTCTFFVNVNGYQRWTTWFLSSARGSPSSSTASLGLTCRGLPPSFSSADPGDLGTFFYFWEHYGWAPKLPLIVYVFLKMLLYFILFNVLLIHY